jgi:hypothetical protein
MVFASIEIGSRASYSNWIDLQSSGKFILLIAFLTFIIEASFPKFFPDQEKYRLSGNYSGIFEEPSHAAYFLIPWILMMLFSGVKKNLIYGALGLLILILFSKSATLFALIGIVAIIILFQRASWIYKIIILTVCGVFFTILLFVQSPFQIWETDPIFSRIMGVISPEEILNISSLVYIQGWQDAVNNVVRSYGFGLGPNMMGCIPLPDVSSRDTLYEKIAGGGFLNSFDGSFLFSKVISEFGIAGIIVYAIFMRTALKREKFNKKHKISLNKYFQALFCCYLVATFIRTSGYFDGLFFCMLTVWAAIFKFRDSNFRMDKNN